ncbi:MAG: hypothetical protein K2H76_10615 [Muribaculaceae bacterium]|nr:hypothetical protein [Muribaculaceae bacterium]MDE6028551.1 hypothetical protein [Muribaculaceae bacterium]
MRKAIFGMLLGGMLLAGCGREQPSPLGNLGQPSLSDSLIYYFGLLEAGNYMVAAEQDTVLATSRERERYLKGLKDGLNAVAEVNDTYNRGLQNGVELALALYGYNRTYGIDLNRDLLYQSIAYALEGGTVIDTPDALGEFHKIIGKLDLKKREEIVKNMHLSLPAEAKRLGMRKLSDDLYVNDANVGVGDSIRCGDIVFATLNYMLESGRNLEMPSSQQLTVGGPTMSDVMVRIYTRMRKGGSAQYATTADALFGSRADQLGLKPQEVVLMSVTINNVENPDSTGKRQYIAI